VRLFSKVNGDWQWNDYTFKAYQNGCNPSPATITSPPIGSSLTGSAVTLQWSSGCDATEYSLWVGSSFATHDLYAVPQGTNRSASITNLPTDGGTLYVRLFSKVNGNWQSYDYTYHAYQAASPGITVITHGWQPSAFEAIST